MQPKRDNVLPNLWVDYLFFYGAAAWLIDSAVRLNRAYQDDWILDGVGGIFLVFLMVYALSITLRDNLAHIANLTAGFTFMLYLVPTVKYITLYGSTTDNAAHLSLMRTISKTGLNESLSIYEFTPGLHSLAAMLSQVSGVEVDLWGNLISALMASALPLGFYMLTKRVEMPSKMGKYLIILSGISQPLLYFINGTSFTIPIFTAFLLVFYLREMSSQRDIDRLPFTVIILILMVQIVYWHPGTSFVIPIVILFSGILIGFDRKRKIFLKRSNTMLFLGLEALIIALTYWMFGAEFIWSHFVSNLADAVQPDLTPDLIPIRFFQVTLLDQISMAIFIHARDALMLAAAAIGFFFVYRFRKSDQFTRLVITSGLIWLLFLGVLVIVFGVSFGAQGYRRFLHYVIASGVILAAYGLWQIYGLIYKLVRGLKVIRLIEGVGIFMILLISLIQIFPFQPLIPNFATKSTPILWLHQVNTIYQYKMLEFAKNNLKNEDNQLIADYIGFKQEILFFGLNKTGDFKRTLSQDIELEAFLLMHNPGKAGGYQEQAEYRSIEQIDGWRNRDGMNTIYDNGESFILYYPDNPIEPIYFEFFEEVE